MGLLCFAGGNMYRIFLVEDDGTLCSLVKKHLESWGYEVTAAEDFSDVMGEFVRVRPQLVLLDLKLPFFNGFHWCDEIRRVSQVPVIFLSSAADNMNMVMAMSRQAILRRAYSFGAGANLLEHGGVILNLGSSTLDYQGKTLDLTKNELRILNLLFSRSGQVVARDAIMQMLWENDDFVDDNTLTVNINRLRRKLESAGLKNMIVTKKGQGYMVP